MHGPQSCKLVVLFYVSFVLIVLFYILFVCKWVLYYCHRVPIKLQLTNVSYRIISYHIISYHTHCYIFQHSRCHPHLLIHFVSSYQFGNCHVTENTLIFNLICTSGHVFCWPAHKMYRHSLRMATLRVETSSCVRGE